MNKNVSLEDAKSKIPRSIIQSQVSEERKFKRELIKDRNRAEDMIGKNQDYDYENAVIEGASGLIRDMSNLVPSSVSKIPVAVTPKAKGRRGQQLKLASESSMLNPLEETSLNSTLMGESENASLSKIGRKGSEPITIPIKPIDADIDNIVSGLTKFGRAPTESQIEGASSPLNVFEKKTTKKRRVKPKADFRKPTLASVAKEKPPVVEIQKEELSLWIPGGQKILNKNEVGYLGSGNENIKQRKRQIRSPSQSPIGEEIETFKDTNATFDEPIIVGSIQNDDSDGTTLQNEPITIRSIQDDNSGDMTLQDEPIVGGSIQNDGVANTLDLEIDATLSTFNEDADLDMRGGWVGFPNARGSPNFITSKDTELKLNALPVATLVQKTFKPIDSGSSAKLEDDLFDNIGTSNPPIPSILLPVQEDLNVTTQANSNILPRELNSKQETLLESSYVGIKYPSRQDLELDEFTPRVVTVEPGNELVDSNEKNQNSLTPDQTSEDWSLDFFDLTSTMDQAYDASLKSVLQPPVDSNGNVFKETSMTSPKSLSQPNSEDDNDEPISDADQSLIDDQEEANVTTPNPRGVIASRVMKTVATGPTQPINEDDPNLANLKLSTANSKDLKDLNQPIDFKPLLVTAKEVFGDLVQILQFVETRIRSFWFGPSPSSPIMSFISNQLSRVGLIPPDLNDLELSGDVLSVTSQILTRYKIVDSKTAVKASLMFSAIAGGGYLASTMFGNLIYSIFKMVGLVVVEPPVAPNNIGFLGGIAKSLSLGVSAAATLIQAFFTLALNFLGALNTTNIIIALLFAAIGYFFYKYKKETLLKLIQPDRTSIQAMDIPKITAPNRPPKRSTTRIQTKPRPKRSKY